MYYELHGSQDPAAATVLLASGLGGAAHYWAPHLAALGQHFRVVAYDQTGTGKSPGVLADGYTIADMAKEAAALLADLSIERCHVIGHALGGLIGLQLALDQPDLVDRLVLVNAWVKTHPHTLRCFAARKSLLLDTGAAAYVAAQSLFLYPAEWVADRQAWLQEQDAMGVAHFPPIETVLRRIAAVSAFDLEARVAAITSPTLVVATRDDILVPRQCSAQLTAMLPNARLALLEHGGHACNITDPAGFDALVSDFLREA